MRASLNMLIVMVIGITMLGCMFKSYRMLNSLESASKYAKQQQQEKARFQQFSQEVKTRQNIRTAPQRASSLKMTPNPFGPRTELRMLPHPFGPPLNLRSGPTLNSGSYAVKQTQPLNSSPQPGSQGSQTSNDSRSSPVSSSGSQNNPSDPAGSVLKGWSGYIATIEKLEKD
jgi:hypothetical protein